MVGDNSFQETPQVDDSILSELHQKFGLNIGKDDQLYIVWEKADEEEGVNVDEAIVQVKKKTMKKMDIPSSKAAPAQQCPPFTLIAPKATSAMTHVSKRSVPLKQKPFSIVEHLRALNETESDGDFALVFRKRKVAPFSDETYTPQVKKVKPI